MKNEGTTFRLPALLVAFVLLVGQSPLLVYAEHDGGEPTEIIWQAEEEEPITEDENAGDILEDTIKGFEDREEEPLLLDKEEDSPLNLVQQAGWTSLFSLPWDGTTDTAWAANYFSEVAFEITTGEELAGLADLVNNSNYDFDGKTILMKGDINLNSVQWTPIGADHTKVFKGTFDGGNYSITGLAIGTENNPEGLYYAGLFGYINEGVLKNLTVHSTGIYNQISGSGDIRNYTGVLAGYNSNSNIENCHATGSTTASYNSNCTFVGFGGLVGYNEGSRIKSSSANVDVIGSGKSDAGGLVGINVGTIENSSAAGAVTGIDADSRVGGLVGYQQSGRTENSYATGVVTISGTGSTAGGLIGWAAGRTENSYATGTVIGSSGYSNIGGLVGENNSNIENTYATGAVSSTSDVYNNTGGLVGQNNGNVKNTYATGAVSSTSDVYNNIGGLVGHNNGRIESGYYNQKANPGLPGMGGGSINQESNISGMQPGEMQSKPFADQLNRNMENNIINTGADGGYRFAWNKVLNGGHPYLTPSGTQFTITFHTGAGSVVVSQKVRVTKTVAEPAPPAWQGYSFTSWFEDSTNTNEYDFDTPVTGNFSLYAGWKEDKEDGGDKENGGNNSTSSNGGSASGGASGPLGTYTIRFDPAGGRPASSLMITDGGKIVQPDDPVRAGSVFTGWYTDASCTTLYDFDKMVTASFTLYAGWEQLNPVQEAIDIVTPYISGYPDGTFRPDASITRGEAAAMLHSLLLQQNQIKLSLSAIEFTDIPEGAWYKQAIAALSAQGILSGYPDGAFQPDTLVTRGEFTAMAINFAGITPLSGKGSFSDVAETHWAAGYIGVAAAQGYLSGYPDGAFRPDAPVTRAEAVAMINSITGRNEGLKATTPRTFSDVASGYWAYEAIVKASSDCIWVE